MILVVDDDISVRESLRLILRRAGYECEAVKSPDEAIAEVRRITPDLIIMDMNYSASTDGEEGIELLRKIRILHPEVPVILITAWGSIPLAVEGMRRGATDFITKPWNTFDFMRHVETALQLTAAKRGDSGSAETDQENLAEFHRVIGKNPSLRKVITTAAKVAKTEAPVLILGENGTGKELIAEAIHRSSSRSGKPFIKVNLGGISQSLFESEMFGHKKGAFTGAVSDRTGRFELADGGTIFLDEIGDLAPACQVKLLRVLQEHTFEPLGDSRTRRVDVRIISATNANLQQMVADRSFREDLFYRINLITLQLPALRDRKEDIALLVKHFTSGTKARFTDEAIEAMKRLTFPGNIRELKNLVERLTIMADDGEITPEMVPEPETVTQRLDDRERQSVTQALALYEGNIAKAAEYLGITRQALYRRMNKYGLR